VDSVFYRMRPSVNNLMSSIFPVIVCVLLKIKGNVFL
jgi:hypothetical protein